MTIEVILDESTVEIISTPVPVIEVTPSSSFHSVSITPTVIATMGSTRTIDIAGEPAAVAIGTLDQTNVDITLDGFDADGTYHELGLDLIGSTGKTFSIVDPPITWDDGNEPVQKTTGSGVTSMLIRSYGDGELRGSHLQRPRTILYGPAGNAAVGADLHRYYFAADARVVAVRLSAGTAPTGASLIMDVNKNGTTLYTTQANRPTLTAASNTVLATLPDVVLFAPGDYMTFDVDQVGSTIAGGSVTLQVDVLEAY